MAKIEHQIGEMTCTVHTDLPPEVAEAAGEAAVFRIYEDSQVYAIVELEFAAGTHVLGMCYRERRNSPLITRVRTLAPGGPRTVYYLEEDSIAHAVEAFGEMVQLDGVAVGHVLTPDLNRGRYAAHCRMMHCEPLARTVTP
jgi:hypothetical protein